MAPSFHVSELSEPSLTEQSLSNSEKPFDIAKDPSTVVELALGSTEVGIVTASPNLFGDEGIDKSTTPEMGEHNTGDSQGVKQPNIPLKVEVTWHDYEHFKNRYPGEGMAVIEVLRGHPYISHEVARESIHRKMKSLNRKPQATPATDSSVGWAQRVRIHSPQLLCLLSRLTGHNDEWPADQPRVFFQPFRMFHYLLPKVKECQRILEERLADVEAHEGERRASKIDAELQTDSLPSRDPLRPDYNHQDVFPKGDYVGDLMEPAFAVSGELGNSPATLSHVRKYVEFVESHIEPRWKQAAGTSKRKVRFNDLWMSFQEGELLYVPPVPSSAQESSTSTMYQRAWRLYCMQLDSLSSDNPQDTQKASRRELDIYAYYVDYNGTTLVPVSHRFGIRHYEGEKDISSLEVFPMRFAKDADKIKASLHEQGQRFLHTIKKKYLYCDGWSLTHEPEGNAVSGDAPAEHVDGDVIVDFPEGYKSEPSLGTRSSDWGLGESDDSDWSDAEDVLTIRHWAAGPGGRLKVASEITEKIQIGERFGEMLTKRTVESRKLLQAYEQHRNVTDIEDDDMVLLPCRVVAYSLQRRKFVLLNTEALSEVPSTQDAFQDLKIDPGHKRMVRSLVKNHLDSQDTRKRRPTGILNQDIIRGKGSGLVILLHGVPGVGKTATAEAVAQANKQPLFVITCGDLGFTPTEVEGALRDIFRLAHHWGCVLLLDEADIFLSRREMGDLKRNALVSVFLRVLEYYSGILFLTTNRVGTLDEAFKSRIHISLYYPPLSKDQTLAIFEVNLRKLHEIEHENEMIQADLDSDAPRRPAVRIDDASIMHYANWHFDVHEDSPQQRWNGRQIRNAFQIAHSLAYFDSQDASTGQWGDDEQDEATNKIDGGPGRSDAPARLDWEQFDQVAKAIERFEDYLYHATAATDRDRARTAHTRADDYEPYQTERTPSYRLPQHRQTYAPPNPRVAPPQRRQYQPPREDHQQLTRGPQQQYNQRPGGPQRGGVPNWGGSPSPGPPRYNPAQPGPRPRDLGTPTKGRYDSDQARWGATPKAGLSRELQEQDENSQYHLDEGAHGSYQDFRGSSQSPYYGEVREGDFGNKNGQNGFQPVAGAYNYD